MQIELFRPALRQLIFDTSIVDHILPIVSSDAFVVLIVIIRHSLEENGFQANLSLLDLYELIGLKERDISRALDELVEWEILNAYATSHTTRYSLNPDFEMEI